MTTTSRLARGREESLVKDPLPLPIAAALDAIARQRAAGEPLERTVADVSARRHLGPRERRATGDAVFAWARRREAVEKLVDQALAKEGGLKPGRHDRDLAALLLAQLASGVEISSRACDRLPPILAGLVDDARARGLVGLTTTVPPWLAASLARAFPEPDDHAALLAALLKPAPLVLAVDPARASVEEVVAALVALKAKAAPSPVVKGAVRIEGRFSLRNLPRELRAAVWPMDDGSQALAYAVDAQPGELVLDLCAGGGGKSRLLATTGARVVSADVSPQRLREAPGTLHVVTDGTTPALAAGRFDRVLVDAPCSGTGTLRRAPDLAHRLTESDIAAFQTTQRALLAQAAQLVKPGGLVIYATCSLLRAENQDVVQALATGKDAPLALVAIPWEKNVHVDGASGQARLTPHGQGTDGFFVAALRRT